MYRSLEITGNGYNPTLTNEGEFKKYYFYEDLQKGINTICPYEYLVLMSYFNVKVGCNFKVWEGIIGLHSIGKARENEVRLLDFYSKNNLFITHNNYKLKEMYQGTGIHPHSKQPHLIDYVVIKQKHRMYYLMTRALRGADGDTDLILVHLKFRYSKLTTMDQLVATLGS